MIKWTSYERRPISYNNNNLLKLIFIQNFPLKPACIPRQGDSLTVEDIPNANCFVAGWGYREEGRADSLPLILQVIKQLFVNRSK